MTWQFSYTLCTNSSPLRHDGHAMPLEAIRAVPNVPAKDASSQEPAFTRRTPERNIPARK